MAKIKTLSCDIETYSDIDLKKSGVYPYAQSPNFEILLFGYSINGGEVKVIDLACGEKIPDEILAALTDDTVEKWAYNAQFERICLSYWLKQHYPQYFQSYSISEDTVGNYLDPSAWKCSRIWGAYMGLPLSLKGIGSVLKLDEQKMSEGSDLIKYFCKPCRPTKANGGRTRNLPEHDTEKWELFKKYNKRDVEVELAIKEKLAKFPVPDFVWDEYHLDQEINDRGILLDMRLVENAISIDAKTKESLRARMRERTGLENPNSVAQMKDWLADNGIETESLDKKAVREIIPQADEHIAEVLSCRQQLAKSSVSKYTAMQNAVCADGRARGMFQFYGANRSGRWAGRIIQLQNLPQNHMDDLAEARSLVRDGNFEALELLYDNIPAVLSELIRTAFVPKPGYKYIVSDFSAIEARVLSFLAGEQWRIDVFKDGKDIYCATASRMFGVPVEKHGANSHLRQKGKQAELACIAEGQLVLTDVGLVPIEEVTTEMKLWDGESWVSHDGVTFKGEREVITYEGLTATPDHYVWIEGKSEPIQFGKAAACGAHLLQTGNGRKAIRLGEDNKPGETMEYGNEPLLCADRMSGLQKHTMAKSEQSDQRKIQGLSAMLTTEGNSQVAGQTAYGGKAKVRKSKQLGIPELRSKRNQIRFSKRKDGGTLSDSGIRSAGQSVRNRPNRYKWELCKGQSSVCNSVGKSIEQEDFRAEPIRAEILALQPSCCYTQALGGTESGGNNSGCGERCIQQEEKLENHIRKARLYDIRNAGRHHRFTVSGKLVHNCGYGGSVGALKAMGALEMGLSEDELQPLVDSWRAANPHITQLWWDIDAAVKQAVIYRTRVETHGFPIYYKSGMLFIDLPSGRRLCYVKPKMGINQFGSDSVTYESTTTGKWGRIESYGPKFVENIVQAVSRDILAYAMKTLRHCFIVGHVHDELIIECDPRVSLKAICEQMGRTPPWIKGLLLRADGYECEFYQKQ